ncbi:MAG: hypothetical protein JEZ08_17540 [Clostridiales bacterium]|nr:hypothetical protein [Clostridiales bacterium]
MGEIKLFDIHSHIIFGVDDGSKTIEESVHMIQQAYDMGVRSMVATPHHSLPKYMTESSVLMERLLLLKKKLIEEEIHVDIYLGSEIYMSVDTVNELLNGVSLGINNTKYLLFECPFYGKTQSLKDYIFKLNLKGYKTIFAHPERYEFVQDNIHVLDELIDMGVYMQLNMASLSGYYGRTVKKTAKKLIKKHMIHFLGTDVHRENSRVFNFDKTIRYLRKKLDPKMYLDVMYKNGEKMINGEEVGLYEVLK